MVAGIPTLQITTTALKIEKDLILLIYTDSLLHFSVNKQLHFSHLSLSVTRRHCSCFSYHRVHEEIVLFYAIDLFIYSLIFSFSRYLLIIYPTPEGTLGTFF